MNIRPDIAEFVSNLEVFSKRKLNYPLEVGELLQMAFQTGLTHEVRRIDLSSEVFDTDAGYNETNRP